MPTCQSPIYHREGLWHGGKGSSSNPMGDHTFAPVAIEVCVALHNICITLGDIMKLAAKGDPVPPSQPVQDDEHGAEEEFSFVK